MRKIREWFRDQFQRMRGVEVVNCSTCPNWRFHSSVQPRLRTRATWDGANVKIVPIEGQQTAERVGVCMKAPLVFVPMPKMGMGVRATTAQDVCAYHPNYVPVITSADAPQFLPGVGDHAGFDKPPSFQDAIQYAKFRPQLAPDRETVRAMVKQITGSEPQDEPRAPLSKGDDKA